MGQRLALLSNRSVLKNRLYIRRLLIIVSINISKWSLACC
jgi:hypothetical protein